MRADVTVSVRGEVVSADAAPMSLGGSLTGPRRGRDATLPTKVPLVAGGGIPPVARATFTEPAFWTPDMPNLYQLDARLLCRGQTVAEWHRPVGLRRFGVRGGSFWLDGRRWVPRGASAPAAGFDSRLLHDLHAAAEMRDPNEALLASADEVGVAVVARLEDAAGRPLDPDRAVTRMVAWSVHPSVMIVVVPRSVSDAGAAAIAEAARALKGTTLLAREVDGMRPPALADVCRADCVVVDLPEGASPHDAWREWPDGPPRVARWRLTAAVDVPGDGEALARRRQECDRLQAGLAAWGVAGADGRTVRDWAGYLVGVW